MTICPTRAPTAAAASTAVRAESGVSTIAHSRPAARRALRTRSRELGAGLLTPRILAKAAAPEASGGARKGVGVLGREHELERGDDRGESNCVPAQRRSSMQRRPELRAVAYGRICVIAENVSATATMRASIGIASALSPSG